MTCWSCSTDYATQSDLNYCPNCGVRLRQPCPYGCGSSCSVGRAIICPGCKKPLVECRDTRKLHRIWDEKSSEGGQLRDPLDWPYAIGANESRTNSLNVSPDHQLEPRKVVIESGTYEPWIVARYDQLYLCTTDGTVRAFRESDLQPLWEAQLRGQLRAGAGDAHIKMIAGRPFLCVYSTDSGRLVLVNPDNGAVVVYEGTGLHMMDVLPVGPWLHAVGTEGGHVRWKSYRVKQRGEGAASLESVGSRDLGRSQEQSPPALCADAAGAYCLVPGMPLQVFRLPEAGDGDPKPVWRDDRGTVNTADYLCCTPEWLVLASNSGPAIVGIPRDGSGPESAVSRRVEGVRRLEPGLGAAWGDRVIVVSAEEGMEPARVLLVRLTDRHARPVILGSVDPQERAKLVMRLRLPSEEIVAVVRKNKAPQSRRTDLRLCYTDGRESRHVDGFLGDVSATTLSRGRAIALRTEGNEKRSLEAKVIPGA